MNNFDKQITVAENIPPQSREVVVSRNGNCFYRALWKDETSNEKHEEINRSSSSMFQKNQKVFELSLATFNYEHSHGLFNTKFSTVISSADLTE